MIMEGTDTILQNDPCKYRQKIGIRKGKRPEMDICLPFQFLMERQRGLGMAETKKVRRVRKAMSGL